MYNMIAFALIFIIFGIFVFTMVRNITFSTVDKQLREAKNEFTEMNVNLEVLYKIFDLGNEGIFEGLEKFQDRNLYKRINNPQIIFVLRDKNGEILNKSDLGRISSYSSSLQFDVNNFEKIYNLKLGERYNYRGLNFAIKSSESSEDRYVQLLINVDSEIILVKNYLKIISYAVIFGIVISAIASFILSKKTLKPIQDVLKKQTEFVQNASHELRTPLTIIQAKQELLLQEPNAQIIDKSEEISLTLNETKRLSKLTKDLMILARGNEKKKEKIKKEDVNFDEFIKSRITPYADIAQAQKKQLIFELECNKEIALDTNKIHQLIVILLDNAIKYTETDDEIKIKTYYKDNKCVMEIMDTGIGISDEGLNYVFDRFYREDRARNRETGGSGLGLSIASMIVNEHNGTIKAMHNQPKGTVFVVKLPR